MTKKNLDLTYDKFREKAKKYINEEELLTIDKAYIFAKEKHFGEKRLTGEDYIVYLLNIAYILTEQFADYETISAALSEGVVEDSLASKKEIEEKFGNNIIKIIEGVITVSNLKLNGTTESAISNHRKILVGMCEDVRVIIILLAKRLYNMRTLWVLPEKEQKEYSLETLEILVPIAHRLGMNKLKSELDDLSLRYSKPDVYFQIVEQLNQTKAERDAIVLKMQQDVSELLTKNGIKHEIKGRAKSIYSIYKKLDTGRPFSDIYDLLALRIFVDTEPECYQVMGIIHSMYRPIPKRFKDFIAMPKSNMYRSLHTTVFGLNGYLFEIQIRTYEMDKVAENGIASHWSYKEKTDGKKQDEMTRKLQFFRSIIELNEEQNNDEEFLKSVKEDVFKNTIYVFTPNGDVIELPNGSTPIDFAYKVHSKIGDKMVGAIVNNSIVPLDYELQDNDVVKIKTNNNSIGPSKEWINIAKTNQAKNKIKSFYNKIGKIEAIKKGEEILNKELRHKKIPINEFLNNTSLDKILKELKLNNVQDLYLGIGNNSILVNQIINILTNETKNKEEKILEKVINRNLKEINSKDDIIVKGIDNIKTNIASCCKPVPKDRIVGYITKGNGVSIHRMICPNISDRTERIIEATWNKKTSKKYPTTIAVYARNEKDNLFNIISKTSNNNITVDSIKTINSKEDVIYQITILVEDKEKLLKFINDINMISSIKKVERYIN